MNRTSFICAISLVLTVAHAAPASASDVEEGEKLFVLQCEICHGAMYEEKTGSREPISSRQRIQLAMLDSVTLSAAQLFSAPNPAGEHLAVALPNGPTLRGVVGRPAASVEGYSYSKSMLETLKGMVWTAENLDRWITNSQAWVPGSFMYYEQTDAAARRKIISYLKANP